MVHRRTSSRLEGLACCLIERVTRSRRAKRHAAGGEDARRPAWAVDPGTSGSFAAAVCHVWCRTMVSVPDMQGLIRQTLDGDEPAWQRLWQHVEPVLYQTLRRPAVLGRLSQSED